MEGVFRVRITHGVSDGEVRMNYVFIENKRVRPVEFISKDRRLFLLLAVSLWRFLSC